MDRSRRNRRGRGYATSYITPQCFESNFAPKKQLSFFNGFINFLIMGSLIALLYLMLDYHCYNCKKCGKMDVAMSIDDIAKNLSFIKESYYDLEKKIMKFSQELPKLEGQLDVIEALANTMEKNQISSNLFSVPKSNVFLKESVGDEANLSCTSNCFLSNDDNTS